MFLTRPIPCYRLQRGTSITAFESLTSITILCFFSVLIGRIVPFILFLLFFLIYNFLHFFRILSIRDHTKSRVRFRHNEAPQSTVRDSSLARRPSAFVRRGRRGRARDVKRCPSAATKTCPASERYPAGMAAPCRRLASYTHANSILQQ